MAKGLSANAASLRLGIRLGATDLVNDRVDADALQRVNDAKDGHEQDGHKLKLGQAKGKRHGQLNRRRLKNRLRINHAQKRAHGSSEHDAKQKRHAAPNALAVTLD